MINFILYVLKFTISVVISFAIILMGLIAIGYIIDLVS